jgi:hypothetical protein
VLETVRAYERKIRSPKWPDETTSKCVRRVIFVNVGIRRAAVLLKETTTALQIRIVKICLRHFVGALPLCAHWSDKYKASKGTACWRRKVFEYKTSESRKHGLWSDSTASAHSCLRFL